MAEALPSVGALDQSGDVGHHEPLPARLRDAQIGRERRERVVGDLRVSPPSAGTGAWTSPRSAGPRDPRRRPCGAPAAAADPRPPRRPRRSSATRFFATCEPHVAAPAATSPRDDGLRPLPHEVGQEPLLVEDHRSVRDRDDEVLPLRPVAAGARARACPGSALRCGWSANHARSWTLRDARNTTSPPRPPSPPSGPSLRLVGLASHRGGAIAAATGAHLHVDLVHERHAEQPRWSISVVDSAGRAKIGRWSNRRTSGWCTSAARRKPLEVRGTLTPRGERPRVRRDEDGGGRPVRLRLDPSRQTDPGVRRC